ncbi:hypothetical protein [Bradyrhizobium sp. AZCC 2230]|uniref:hypothetical protein n=1 Tax=Bradyrhizobium sp. AZCC 2230 TaxID=3117021 RepID=UPI002FF428FA
MQSALLPFAFACFVDRGRVVPAIAALVLLGAFYPATLSKFAAFAPLWLLFLLILQRFSKPENAVILSVLLPLLVGLASLPVESGLHHEVYRVFGLINFRMFGITSISMEVYNAFFFNHEPTHFCQIGFVRSLIGCLIIRSSAWSSPKRTKLATSMLLCCRPKGLHQSARNGRRSRS